MLIQFIKPDPRAGTVVQMDSSRGQQFIDAGHAQAVSEGVEPAREAKAPAVEAEPLADKPARKRSK